MRKKYLSALLFGALLVTSTGTFTSCKDYDDDINNLQEQVDGVKSQIADLESKINDGKWITNIADAEGGFTITFSDNSSYTIVNGKDGANGADGAAGTPGTQWTISEDGYWVCDGEKTDVKAVGQDGKDGQDGQNGQDGAPGQDAQPEVKKENGKWYLWNGTEFEELSIPAPAVNVPYYYIDPNDNNYAVLVISDENGANKKEIRLPLNEGLAQIKVLSGGNIKVNYAYSKEGSAFEEWDGPKAKPAKGELIVTQSADSILVQVTPANYDLASLKESLKIVNAENEDAPLVLGEPVPYSGKLTNNSRAASNTGMYLIPVKFNNVVNEDAEYYSSNEDDYPFVSIFANEKVRSDYNGNLTLGISDRNDGYVGEIVLGQNSENDFRNFYAYVTPGETFTIDVANYIYGKYYQDQYMYDAYVTMYDGSELSENATEAEKETAAIYVEQSLANQVRYGIELDGLTIKCNDKAAGWVYFSVHYIDVRGVVRHRMFSVNYSEAEVPTETITSIESVNHVTTGDADNQYMIYDLAPYFDEMTEAERLVWNDEFNVGNIRFDVDDNFYINEDGDKIENAYKWTYEDPETGLINTMPVYKSIFESAVAVDANGEVAKTGKDVAKLKVTFSSNYDGLDVATYSEGSLMTTITFKNYVRTEDGYYEWNEAAYFELPFTLDEPTAEELAEQYSYNSHYYDATAKQFIIVDQNYVNIRDLFAASVTDLDYNDVEVSSEDITFNNGDITLGDDVEKGKVYTISGATFRYLNSTFELPAMNIKFVNSKSYTLNTASANVSVQSGTTEAVTISYAEKATTTIKSFYNVKDVFNKYVAVDDITSVIIDNFDSPTGQTGADLLTVSVDSNNNIVVTPTTEKASVDATATVKIKVEVEGETLEGSFTVTVKAYPHN